VLNVVAVAPGTTIPIPHQGDNGVALGITPSPLGVPTDIFTIIDSTTLGNLVTAGTLVFLSNR
jgi:hypothetical protein